MFIVATIQKAMFIVAKSRFIASWRANRSFKNYRNYNSFRKFTRRKLKLLG
jgi:hypothetical protein